MGARGKNFYHNLATRYGFGEVADHIQDLYLSGRKAEAIDAVPDELVRHVSLIGPRGFVKERVAAYAEAGVTTLLVHPLTGDRRESVRFVEELQGATGLTEAPSSGHRCQRLRPRRPSPGQAIVSPGACGSTPARFQQGHCSPLADPRQRGRACPVGALRREQAKPAADFPAAPAGEDRLGIGQCAAGPGQCSSGDRRGHHRRNPEQDSADRVQRRWFHVDSPAIHVPALPRMTARSNRPVVHVLDRTIPRSP